MKIYFQKLFKKTGNLILSIEIEFFLINVKYRNESIVLLSYLFLFSFKRKILIALKKASIDIYSIHRQLIFFH